ncbi:MAG: hypothetical protein P0Y53_12915 [Candidatus Pseudobacter hemicellulosilyticus]|uniref:Uncharacterized protein n=1 Tax=Candidatus Pseudobacter hemicellulosilyticus TaxID=3121375 RepID=A0AAJ5X1H5_9BACT|nr:MAG: hypothetical protein P0Y53_12915 [Pseudobacter sp.]
MAAPEKPSFIERLKQRATSQQSYGGEGKASEAASKQAACPHCGAGRGKEDGLTHCAYCGHAFIQTRLTDGKYLHKEDNSQ